MKKFISFTLIFMLLGMFVNAQVSMTTTGSYFQNFNSLLNTGTANKWKNDSTLTSWYGQFRSGTLSTYRADNGSSNTGAIYSYGSTGLTERCLGSVCSGTPDSIAFGVLLQNNSSSTITDITVTYVGEQWRCAGKITNDTLKFFYKVSSTAITDLTPADNSTWTAVPALHFVSPTTTLTAAAINGNIDTNQVVFTNISLPALSIPAGNYIMLRWFDPNDPGSDHGMGIDSLYVNWTIPAGGNTVATGAITGSPFTVTPSTGSAVSVPYTTTGTFNAGNVFTAYLSDATGSFASETAIGTLNSQTDGTISATIPANTPSGTAYRIRVKASDPATTGTDNGTNLTIVLNTPDVIPPVATTAYATSLSNIVVVFNEKLDPASAQTTTNYTFVGGAVTGNATLNTKKDTVNLTLSTPLTTAVVDTLRVTGIADSIGNAMTLTYKFPVVYGSIVPAALDTIVFWNFPNNPDDSIADGGIPANLTKLIGRENSFYATDTCAFGFAGATTNSIRSLKWDAGTGVKYWQIEFTTALYDSICFSSKQRSSNTGPRNFRTEYSLDGATWTPVTGGNVLVANNYTSGVLNKVKLPVDCYNASSVRIRWIMTTDTASNGTIVASAGASNIDDIYVFGRYNPILGVNCATEQPLGFSLYPNPANGSFAIQLEKNAEVRIDIMNITGQLVRSENRSGSQFRFDISDLSKGMYIIRLTNLADQTTSVRKLSVQ